MALNEDDQMQAVFISTRTPVEIDPVSGNEVPPGSLPEEVRDDIPAQLSEGEYVVPADVLRFYGIKFFEDLRENAKIELARMEAEGRIGGEPVEPTQQGDLTAEEMAEIEKMTMAVGGFSTQQPTQSTQPDPYQQQQMMYRQGAPVAMGNAGYDEGGQVRGYNSSSVVTSPPPPVAPPPPVTPVPANTQAQLDFSQFGAGFSFSPQAQDNLEQISQASFPEPEFTPVTMYGPNNGKPVVEAKTLEQYNKLLAEGYTLTPPVIDNDNGGGGEDQDPPDPTAWADDLDFTDTDAMNALVDEYLAVAKGEKEADGKLPGFLGAATQGIDKLQGVARSYALANMVEIFDPEEAERMRKKIDAVPKEGIFKIVPEGLYNGTQITSLLKSKFGATAGDILSSFGLRKYGKTYGSPANVLPDDATPNVSVTASEDSQGNTVITADNESSQAAGSALQNLQDNKSTYLETAAETGGESNVAATQQNIDDLETALSAGSQNPSGTISLKEGGLASKTKKKKNKK